jgi:hypothetical protein
MTVREVARNRFRLKSKGFLDSFARWFTTEKKTADDMEGLSVGGGLSKVVKFTRSNRVMTVSELRNLVYQKTLAGKSKRSHTAHTQTQVKKFEVLRKCCNSEARVLLHDHFEARIDPNWDLHKAVEAENLQLETQTAGGLATRLRCVHGKAGGQGAGPGAGPSAGDTGSSASPSPQGRGGWRTATAITSTSPSWRGPPSGPTPATAPCPSCPTKETPTGRPHHSDGRLRPAGGDLPESDPGGPQAVSIL